MTVRDAEQFTHILGSEWDHDDDIRTKNDTLSYDQLWEIAEALISCGGSGV
jgi:hypothetical protein